MYVSLFREDIEHLEGVGSKKALQIMRDIRAHYELPKKRSIPLKAYCDYSLQDKEDVLRALALAKHRQIKGGDAAMR
jgi:hypothetical protein